MTETVTIKILQRNFQIACSADDVKSINANVKIINTQLQELKKSIPNASDTELIVINTLILQESVNTNSNPSDTTKINKFAEQIKTLENQLATSNGVIDTVTTEKNTADAHIKTLGQEIVTLKKSAQAANQWYEKSKTLEENIEHISNKYSELETALNHSETEINALKTELQEKEIYITKQKEKQFDAPLNDTEMQNLFQEKSKDLSERESKLTEKASLLEKVALNLQNRSKQLEKAQDSFENKLRTNTEIHTKGLEINDTNAYMLTAIESLESLAKKIEVL